jgi:Fe-S cluster assembly protein SufD
VEIFGVWAGGRWTVLREEATMAAPGSSWKETHVVWGGGKDHTDIETRVLHLAPRTRSDIHVRAALSDRARCAFSGNVVMEKEAVLADARLEDHVLLLSESARSDSVPALEIRAMDVKASHAASTGPVDPEALFYLLSRGLDEVQARHLLVKGFLASLVDRAPFPLLSEMLDTQLESRVTR